MARKDKTVRGKLAGSNGRTVSEAGRALKRESWTAEAYQYADDIAELGYIAHLVANAVARGNLIVEQFVEIGDDGEPVEGDIPDEIDSDTTYEYVRCELPEVKAHMMRFKGKTGGPRELKRRAALGLFIAGECHLLGIPDDVTDEINYEFLSSMELITDDEGNMRRLGVREVQDGGMASEVGGSKGVPVPGDAFYQRLHRPHHMISGDPDSPMRRVLSLCKELSLLSQMVEAQAKSRLSAGVLYVPNEISFGADDQFNSDAGVGDSDDLDPVEEALLDHMSAPVEDRTSTASMVPLVMRGPAEHADKVKLIAIAHDIAKETSMLRGELITRIAQGIDAPPEIVTGMGKSTHWSAVTVDKDLLMKHVVPLGDLIADFITESYLRPALIGDGMDPDQAEWFRVVFDISVLLGREDAGASSRAIWDRDELSNDSLLRAAGYDPEIDSPSDEERKHRMLMKLITSKPSHDAREAIRLLGEIGYFENTDIVIPEAIHDPQVGDEPVGVDDNNVEEDNDDIQTREQPATGPDTDAASSARPTVARIHTAAEMAMGTALDKAASRLLSAAGKANYESRDKWRQLSKIDVLADCGQGGLSAMNVSSTKLFDDAWGDFAKLGRRWIRDQFVSNGIPEAQADTDASLIMGEICLNLETLAQVAFETPFYPDPNTGYRVPLGLIEESLWLAMGMV